jgi:glutaminyl-peptide cyclotransferase
VQLHAEEIRAMVLLDYIGNKGLRLPREGSSTSSLWDDVRAAAQRVGVGAVFPDRTQAGIFDDHTPFLRAGIPAVDLIDWSYPYQHQLTDSLS